MAFLMLPRKTAFHTLSELQQFRTLLREQIASVSLAQLLEAFLFYYDHDAFITFGE